MIVNKTNADYLDDSLALSEIWSLINDKYALFEDNGASWKSVKSIYEEKAKQMPEQDLYDIIEDMILELGDPHTKLNRKTMENTYISPVVIYYLSGEFYVCDSSIADSKLNKGMKIIEINNMPISMFLEEEKRKLKYKSMNMVIANAIEGLSSATYKKAIKLSCQDNDCFVSEDIEFLKITDLALMNTAKQNKENIKFINSRTIGNVFYYKLFGFNNGATKLFLDTIEQYSSCEHLIVDLRGNIGGLIEEAKKFAALFLKEKKIIGYEKLKSSNQINKTIIEPCEINIMDKYKHIVFLCDNFTASSTEFILLRAVKNYNDKIMVIGTQTAGFPHSATVFTLMNNYRLQVTTIMYTDENGKAIVEEGIYPDIEVFNDGRFITEGIDNQLEYALGICRDKT